MYWCTADPGWVTGISDGVISPLCNRATLVVDNAEFDLNRWHSILENENYRNCTVLEKPVDPDKLI